jgi:hypothetical protein
VRASLLALVVVLGAGCSLRKLTINMTADLMHEGSRAFAAETDVELAREAAPGQIKSLEGLLVSAPRHRVLLEMAARACLEYSFGFLEDDVETLPRDDAPARRSALARATKMYDRAFAYAVRHLETFDAGIGSAIARGGATLEAAVARLPRESVPGLTYGGMALASAVNLNKGDPARIADLPRARILIERAHALDARYYDGGAAMILGVMRVQSGDEPRARAYFDEAVAVTGGKLLLPRVLKARTLLVETHARKDFDSELEAVLAAPRDALPRARLSNEIARRRAARYLAEAEKLF